MFTIYKPTQKNTGGAASFKTGQGGVFAQVLKQKSWDGKNGDFDVDSKLTVFLKDVEIATMLRILEVDGENLSTPHVQKDGTTTNVRFGEWKDQSGKLRGYGFSLSQGDKKASVSFNLNEAELLKRFLEWALNEAFKHNANKVNATLKKNKETRAKGIVNVSNTVIDDIPL